MPRLLRSYAATELNKESVVLGAGQCQLRYQEMAAVQAGWPPALVTKGAAAAAFTCGAPLVAWGPQVPGFQRSIGQGLYTWCARTRLLACPPVACAAGRRVARLSGQCARRSRGRACRGP